MKNPRLLKALSILLLAAFLVTLGGCYGSFNLTKKVYKWNGSVGDKWVNELVFLVFLAVPVYEIAGLIDIVVLNSIEFWSGKNPASADNTIQTGDPSLTIRLDREHQAVEITKKDPTGGESVYRIARDRDASIIKDGQNQLLFTCTSTDDGGLVLTDAAGKVVASYTALQLASLYR